MSLYNNSLINLFSKWNNLNMNMRKFNGLLYLFTDWSVIINANIFLKDGLDVYIENSCDPWGRKHVYGKILLNFPFIDKFKKIYFYYIPIVMNFLFIFMTVNFFNNYKSNKKYFILFFLFSAPFLLAIERANTDVLIFLILYLLCKYKNTIQQYITKVQNKNTIQK